MTDSTDSLKTSVLAHTLNYSTRFLIEVCVDPSKYHLEFVSDEQALVTAIKNNEYNIYIIDATRAATTQPSDAFRIVSGLVLRNATRVVAVADKAPADVALKMAEFGPLAVVSYCFSSDQIQKALEGVLNMQAKWTPRQDTGSRVKSDPKFFKEQRFKE
jgi:hypothetical protein